MMFKVLSIFIIVATILYKLDIQVYLLARIIIHIPLLLLLTIDSILYRSVLTKFIMLMLMKLVQYASTLLHLQAIMVELTQL